MQIIKKWLTKFWLEVTSDAAEMRFKDLYVNKTERFSIGIEQRSGRYFLSFPVANRLCDYEEYYYIDKSIVDNYPANMDEVLVLLAKSRSRENDNMLIIQPGADRGSA